MTSLIIYANKQVVSLEDVQNIADLKDLFKQDTDESLAKAEEFMAANPWLSFHEVSDEQFVRIMNRDVLFTVIDAV